MEHELLFACGGHPAPGRPGRRRPRGEPVRLRIGTGPDDVHLQVGRLSRRLRWTLPPAALDLLDVAAYVYAADQSARRGGTGSFDYGRDWRRCLAFEIPVRLPDLWSSPEVAGPLADVLSFLTDDRYEFRFFRHPDPPAADAYLFGEGSDRGTAGVEEAVLFSGGLDSLGGAVAESLGGGRPVLLVSHRPSPKVFARQRALFDALSPRTPRGARPRHLAVEVNKGKDLGAEFTQRSRSFLFAAIGAVSARAFGLDRLRFYENGVTSLNLPPSPQIVGGRASRTTHPRALDGFGRVLSAAFGRPFAVDNPFRGRTKAEVLAGLRDAGQADLCALAVSCGHTWHSTSARPHCGLCSQCLDRRLAAVAAGLSDAHDPPGGYATDVWEGERGPADRILAERYVGAAMRVAACPDAGAFAAAFPEVLDAAAAGEAAGSAVRAGFDLYGRHAAGVLAAVRTLVGRSADRAERRDYPPNSLLAAFAGAAWGAAGPVPATPAGPPAPDRLEVDGEGFEVRRPGRPACFLGNTREFRLAERLNRRPDRFVPLAELIDDVWGGTQVKANTVQKTVCNLRRKLLEAVRVDVDGSQPGHYRLALR